MPIKPFEYQRENADAHLQSISANGASLDASRPGAGKTVIGALTAQRLGMKVGVLCPKRVISKWRDMLAEFGVTPDFVVNPELARRGNQPYLAKSGKSFKWNWHGFLIVDEAHDYGGISSQNGAMLSAAKGMPVLLLSATLAESPLQLKAPGFILGLHNGRGFWAWAQKHGATRGEWGGLEYAAGAPENVEIMSRLHDAIFSCRGARVSEDVLKEFMPESMVVDEPLDLSPADLKTLEAAYAEIREMDNPGAVRDLRFRQAIELVKCAGLAEEALSIVAEGAAPIVFLNFHASIDALSALCPRFGVLDGRVPQVKRDAICAEFQANQMDGIIVQIAAGGQSIDLHDVRGDKPRIALICPQFGGRTEEQAQGRHNRVGAKSFALTRRLFVAQSLEAAVAKTASTKIKNLSIINMGKKEETAVVATERVHAKHSPSSLKEKAKCGHFRNDNTRDSTLADEGTIGHESVEKENLAILPSDNFKLISGVKKCIGYVHHLRASRPGVSFKEVDEVKVHYLDEFGYFDKLFMWEDGASDLVDYKFARSAYVADSPQFWAYSVGVFDKWPEIHTIKVHVVLPYRDEIDIEVFTRDEHYELLFSKITAIVHNAENPDAPYMTGSHCQWCVLRGGDCPELNKVALAIATEWKEGELVIPDELSPENITNPVTMARAMHVGPVLASWASKVKDRALEMVLHENQSIPGFTLKEKNAAFQITDPQLAWMAVEDRVTPQAFAACAKLNIGALEKAYGQTFPRGEMGKSKDALRSKLIDMDAGRADGTVHFLSKDK